MQSTLKLNHFLEQTAKGLREGTKGSDRIKSRNPFLQAVASAEETLEDRNTKIWEQSSGMEDVWRRSQHPPLPAPSPATHSQALIELLCHLLLLSGELWAVYSMQLPWCSHGWEGVVQEWQKIRNEKWELAENASPNEAFRLEVSNNGKNIWLRFTKVFPDITLKLRLPRMQGSQESPAKLKYIDSDFVPVYFGSMFDFLCQIC